MLRFRSIISLDERILPHKLAEFVIMVRFKLTAGVCVRWREISMSTEDMTGAHVSGGKSLKVLSQVLYSLRSNNHQAVEKGYREYTKLKTEMRKAGEIKDTLAISCVYHLQS